MATVTRSFSTKGGKKLRRCARKTGYYTNQFIRTAKNKVRRAARRRVRREYWLKRGVRKNGLPVGGTQ